MSFLSYLRNWMPTSTHERRRPRVAARQPASFRPRLEALEGRDVPSSTMTVTNTLDSGHGSLRYEIAQAEKSNGKATVDFNIPKTDPGYNATTGVWTITLTRGEVDITGGLKIQGPGAGFVTVSGGRSSRVFEVAQNVTVAMSGLTITQGNSGFALTDYYASGGDIVNLGTLTLSGCTVSDGTTVSGDGFGNGGPGGDVFNVGSMTLIGCTISGGDAGYEGGGGGIYNG